MRLSLWSVSTCPNIVSNPDADGENQQPAQRGPKHIPPGETVIQSLADALKFQPFVTQGITGAFPLQSTRVQFIPNLAGNRFRFVEIRVDRGRGFSGRADMTTH